MSFSQSPPESTDILVIGAGPAGLSAAAFAGSLGFDVTVLDENARPGGQYYRQSRLAGRLDEKIVGPSQTGGLELLEELDPARVRICCDTTVWGADGARTVLYTHDGGNGRIVAKAVIVATGAHERVLPFPGWTLPGVMTAGAAQTLLKAQAILPGKNIVIAGTGPFLYPVATQLAAAGASIEAVCELNRSRLWPLRVRRPYRHLALYREALGYLVKMRRLGLSIQFGSTVIEARGDTSLREVTIAQMDDNMVERRGSRRTVSADTLLTSFGFVPNTQVARLLGCELRWDEVQKAHVVNADARLQSSVPGIYVAGEIAGIGGHRVARAEGTVAAASAIEDLSSPMKGFIASRKRTAERARSAYRDFANHMVATFALQPAILDLSTADTVVCRCESVPRSEIEHYASLWEGSQRAVKQNTRAGMGRCQGRICGYAVTQLCRNHARDHARVVVPDTIRMPVKPLRLTISQPAGEPEAAISGAKR
jgi:NADPH-dependent 2,4-dienoyl-CoA reductase/sulfur reductase-like enzyme